MILTYCDHRTETFASGLFVKALHGDRSGQFSIRVNMQWRICFTWPEGDTGPSGVEIVDYH